MLLGVFHPNPAAASASWWQTPRASNAATAFSNSPPDSAATTIATDRARQLSRGGACTRKLATESSNVLLGANGTTYSLYHCYGSDTRPVISQGLTPTVSGYDTVNGERTDDSQHCDVSLHNDLLSSLVVCRSGTESQISMLNVCSSCRITHDAHVEIGCTCTNSSASQKQYRMPQERLVRGSLSTLSAALLDIKHSTHTKCETTMTVILKADLVLAITSLKS